jgi:hypothetical protein
VTDSDRPSTRRARLVRALLPREDMRHAVIAMIAGLLSMSSSVASADQDLQPCRTYRTTMQAARTALVQGDRAAALAALQQAKALLQQCRRDEARHMDLFAATDVASRDA